MNYASVYQSLISRAQQRIDAPEYIETHHIVPRCMGGVDTSDNLVNLSAREHYVAHILLAKIHGGKLWHAVHMMSNMQRYSSRAYERARLEHSRLLSEQNRKIKPKPKEIRTYWCSYCGAVVTKIEFCHHTAKKHYYCNARCRNLYSAAHRKSIKGISLPHLHGRPTWNKGIPNPKSAENGKRGAEKQSAKVTGRKRKYLSDGSWVWEYPTTSVSKQVGTISESKSHCD